MEGPCCQSEGGGGPHKKYTTNLFWYSPDSREALTEDNVDTFSSTAKGRCGTVKGSVTSTENNDITVEFWKLRLARTHTLGVKSEESVSIKPLEIWA